METEILRYVPAYWSQNKNNSRYNVSRFSDEFRDLEKYFDGFVLSKIERIEDIIRYGQFMVRQQHLIALNPFADYYLTRKFVTVDNNRMGRALEYNLDERRCQGDHFVFSSNVPESSGGKVVFVVVVVTNQPYTSEFTPTRDSDFYIEHIVYLD